MPSFNPFSTVTGRHSYSLFDIRLDNDFIVFRGNEHESTGQLLKGVVVLCLPSSLRIEDVHLRLVGTLRISSASGVSGQKIDKTSTLLEHRWPSFVGGHGKSMTLPAGNYEYPFEYMLPGDTAESLEGIPEASITYRLKATVGRGKLAYDLHSYKHVRIIRTLEPGALEFLHAMSVENIWPNKIDYSIVIPQKAVVFGGLVDMEMRFSPLLKGLELGDITANMVEIRETCAQLPSGYTGREHRVERDVATWKFTVDRDECWQDMIEDTGQEGWAMTKKLSLPRRLRQCVQDFNLHGIKIRHKIKLTVALRNPDGHISELRATLPISIFISPNMPLDEQGNLLDQAPGAAGSERDPGSVAPPGYGEHVLDQLYEDVDPSGYFTPGGRTPGIMTPGVQSGFSSPFYAQSRAGSSENLSALTHSAPVTPAALVSRLTDVSLDPSRRNSSYGSLHTALASGMWSPTSAPQGVTPRSETRRNSEEDDSGRTSPEHLNVEFAGLNRVPSYDTAVRTPARSRAPTGPELVPDYITALNAPRAPPVSDSPPEALTPVAEEVTVENAAAPLSPRTSHTLTQAIEDPASYRRVHLMQARGQVF
ncbi:putative HECT-type ubiquitin ligase-interacting protein creD [Paramyrothecium foliicola]|nr:putative HECT-type ubiquitin ligase-interacting protein creD [Paramyrothecium foliicola]